MHVPAVDPGRAVQVLGDDVVSKTLVQRKIPTTRCNRQWSFLPLYDVGCNARFVERRWKLQSHSRREQISNERREWPSWDEDYSRRLLLELHEMVVGRRLQNRTRVSASWARVVRDRYRVGMCRYARKGRGEGRRPPLPREEARQPKAEDEITYTNLSTHDIDGCAHHDGASRHVPAVRVFLRVWGRRGRRGWMSGWWACSVVLLAGCDGRSG